MVNLIKVVQIKFMNIHESIIDMNFDLNVFLGNEENTKTGKCLTHEMSMTFCDCF